jgi:hypothetical protein
MRQNLRYGVKEFPGAVLWFILILLIFVSNSAWGNAGNYACSTSAANGRWVVKEWASYSAEGCKALNPMDLRPIAVASDTTVGNTRIQLLGFAYCDEYAGARYVGKKPWGCETKATGTQAEAPLLSTISSPVCEWANDPYPDFGHPISSVPTFS